jgi:hypothetical protein
MPRSFRWSGDIIALGKATGAPSAVALGYMAEAFTLYWQGNNRASLERLLGAQRKTLAYYQTHDLPQLPGTNGFQHPLPQRIQRLGSTNGFPKFIPERKLRLPATNSLNELH